MHVALFVKPVLPEMAQEKYTVCEFSSMRVRSETESRKDQEFAVRAPDSALYLNSTKLMRLGWQPRVPMSDAYRRLTAYLREQAHLQESTPQKNK